MGTVGGARGGAGGDELPADERRCIGGIGRIRRGIELVADDAVVIGESDMPAINFLVRNKR